MWYTLHMMMVTWRSCTGLQLTKSGFLQSNTAPSSLKALLIPLMSPSSAALPQTLILYNTTHLISCDNWSVDEHTTEYTMYMYSQVILHLLNPLPLYHSNNTHTHVTVYVLILFPLTLSVSSGGTDTPVEGGVVWNTIHNDK